MADACHAHTDQHANSAYMPSYLDVNVALEIMLTTAEKLHWTMVLKI